MTMSDGKTNMADLRRRIDVLRVDLAQAERKATRVQVAIAARRTTLNRLLAQLAMSEAAAARDDHER